MHKYFYYYYLNSQSNLIYEKKNTNIPQIVFFEGKYSSNSFLAQLIFLKLNYLVFKVALKMCGNW